MIAGLQRHVRLQMVQATDDIVCLCQLDIDHGTKSAYMLAGVAGWHDLADN